MAKPATIDAYIATFPKDVQGKLQQVRAAVKQAAPEALEIISYGIPAFKQNGMLVWFGAHTNHIGFYPRGSGIEEFKEELAAYKSAKGSVQFRLEDSMPVELITKIVKFRLTENLQKTKRNRTG